jgi:hypothetical protein
MRDLITDVLDAVGLLAVAAGIGAGAARWIGWFGLAVSGGVVLVGSVAASMRTGRPAGGER